MPNGEPPFKSGDRHIDHTFLNRVGRATDRVLDYTGGFAPDFGPDARITVLITQEPEEGDRVLRVRRVGYRNPIPEVCDDSRCYYTFTSEEFGAYLDIGVEDASDYESWGGELPLKHDEPYMKAYREEGTWRVEKPAASTAEIDYCVIIQTSTVTVPNASIPGDASLGAFRLRVQRIHLNDQGVYVAKGSPLVVSTRPNVPGTLYDDYRRYNRNGVGTGNPATDGWTWSAHANMVTFQAAKSDGLWRVEQPPPLVTRAFPTGTAAGCSVV